MSPKIDIKAMMGFVEGATVRCTSNERAWGLDAGRNYKITSVKGNKIRLSYGRRNPISGIT